jgi:hypothetical protein
MTFKLQAQAGSCRRSCGVTPRTISGMPSSSEQDDWGACTFFGTVPLLPPTRVDGYGVARPCLAAVIEGGQRHCISEAYATPSDLSRSFTLSGQRSKRGAPYGVSCGRERDTAYRPVSAHNTAPHYPRNHGNPCAEKVSAHRPRQNKPAVRRESPDDVGACQQWHSAGADRQGTLTITGSNVRLGTEMPVALSLFFT